MINSVVDRIHALMERQDVVSSDSVEPLATAYAAEVGQVNDRLAACVNLLRKGLRSEAIQQASIRPNLIEWCAILDFAEIEAWYEILKFFQLERPRTLNREAVRLLQEALIEEQSLDDLLRHHRRMALGKAPLSGRLQVLRRIAQVDSTNPVWTEDVKLWEKARLRQIPLELEAVAKSSDATACRVLVKEVSSNAWRIQPPRELVQEVNAVANELQFASQNAELRVIGAAMSDAFCASDEAKCREQQLLWSALIASMKKPPKQDVLELAEPAILWLEQQDFAKTEEENRLQAVAELEVAIDRSESSMSLMTAYNKATRFGEPLGLKLESRYRSALGELQLRGVRQTVLKVSAIATVALCGLVAFGVWQWRSIRERDVKTAATALNQLLDEKKLTEAQQYMDNLLTSKPHVAKSAAVQAIAGDLSGRAVIEADRLQNFSKYLQEADNADPALINISTLQSAENLASTEAEKEQVFEIQQRRAAYDRKAADKQFQELKVELTRLTQEVDSLEAKELGELNDATLERTLQVVDDLRRKFPNVGTGGTVLIDALHKRTNSLRASVSQATVTRESEFNALKLIREANSLQSLEQALSNFGFQASKSPLADQFAGVLNESKYWKRVTEWNEFTDGIAGYLRTHDAEVIPSLFSRLIALEQSISLNPILETSPALHKTLERIVKRGAILDRLTAELEKDIRSSLSTLEAPTRSGLAPLRFFAYSSYVKDSKNQDRLTSSGGKGIEVLTAEDGTVATENLTGVVIVRDDPAKLYNELLGNIKLGRREFLNAWESSFLDLIKAVLKRAELDQKIKEHLIAKLIASASEGSELLSQAWAENLDFLTKRAPKIRTNWYQTAPFNPQLDFEVTDRLNPTLSKTLKDLQSIDAPLRLIAAGKLHWVGSIQRDAVGQFQAILAKQPKTSGKLYLIQQRLSTGDAAALTLVGTIRDGTQVLSGDQTQFVAGRPLFFWATDVK